MVGCRGCPCPRSGREQAIWLNGDGDLRRATPGALAPLRPRAPQTCLPAPHRPRWRYVEVHWTSVAWIFPAHMPGLPCTCSAPLCAHGSLAPGGSRAPAVAARVMLCRVLPWLTMPEARPQAPSLICSPCSPFVMGCTKQTKVTFLRCTGFTIPTSHALTWYGQRNAAFLSYDMALKYQPISQAMKIAGLPIHRSTHTQRAPAKHCVPCFPPPALCLPPLPPGVWRPSVPLGDRRGTHHPSRTAL